MKLLKIVVLIIATNCVIISNDCHAQTNSGTTTLSNKDLNNAKALIEEGFRAKELNAQYVRKIDVLTRTVAQRDSTIVGYEKIVANLDERVVNLQAWVSNVEQQNRNLEAAFKQAIKNERRAKRRTVFVGVAGIIFSYVAFTMGGG